MHHDRVNLDESGSDLRDRDVYQPPPHYRVHMKRRSDSESTMADFGTAEVLQWVKEASHFGQEFLDMIEEDELKGLDLLGWTEKTLSRLLNNVGFRAASVSGSARKLIEARDKHVAANAVATVVHQPIKVKKLGIVQEAKRAQSVIEENVMVAMGLGSAGGVSLWRDCHSAVTPQPYSSVSIGMGGER